MAAARATTTAAMDMKITRTPDLADTVNRLALLANWLFDTGDGVDQIDNIVHDEVAIAASQTEALNLQSIVNPFGQSVGFAAVKLMYFEIVTLADVVMIVGVDPAHPSGNLFDSWLEWDGVARMGVTLRSDDGSARGGAQLIAAPDASGYMVDATHKTLLMINDNAVPVTMRYVIMGVQP
jgi:hypothetical protein